MSFSEALQLLAIFALIAGIFRAVWLELDSVLVTMMAGALLLLLIDLSSRWSITRPRRRW